MTEDKNFKRLIREHSRTTGMRYAAARRAILSRGVPRPHEISQDPQQPQGALAPGDSIGSVEPVAERSVHDGGAIALPELPEQAAKSSRDTNEMSDDAATPEQVQAPTRVRTPRFRFVYVHGDFVDDPHDRALAERLMWEKAEPGAPIAYCSRCDLFVPVGHFDGCGLSLTIKRRRRVFETQPARAARERKKTPRRRSQRALRNLFIGADPEAVPEQADERKAKMQRPRSRVRRNEEPSVAPASELDYVRACTLAKEAYRLLLNTSTLAWQIYGVTSPQGRDGDKILEVGQVLFGALRCDALDLWLPEGPWAEECGDDSMFRRFYPPRRKDVADLPDEVLALGGRGARGRCPKRMPLEAHREASQAHYEAQHALQQLEILLAPHQRYKGTLARLKGCQRLLELADRQQDAFQLAWAVEHGASTALGSPPM